MKKSFSKFNIFLSALLLLGVTFSVIKVVNAVTPNPGHSWSEVGDGVFAITGPTSLRTFTFPDADAAVLTGNGIVKGGLITGTGAGTVGITTVGTDGQLLSADSASAGGVKWITASGTGTVTSVSVVTANGVSGSVANASTTPAITLTLGAITPTTVNGITFSGSSTPALAITGTTTVSGTNTGDQTSVSGNAGTATALQNARTIGGVSFNGTADITVATATGGFTISGGNLDLGTNSITMTGSLGATGARLTKGWFTDLQVTNPIVGSITGNAATVTTNANLTGPITSSGNATSVAAQTGTGSTFVMQTSPTLTTPNIGAATATSVNKVTVTAPATGSTLTIDDGFTLHATGNATVSGTNTGDQTSVSGNAGTVTVADAGGDTTTFPLLGTSATGSLAPATDSGLSYNSTTDILTATGFAGPLTGNVTGNVSGSSGSTTGNAATATALQNARTIGGVSFNGTANITVATATGGFTISGGDLALAANNITMTGSLGATGARLTKGWFDDLQVTNAIVGDITGNAATVTTNANLTGAVTSTGNATVLGSFSSSDLAGAVTGETGSGALVFATSPSFTTPSLGAATASGLTLSSITGSVQCLHVNSSGVVSGTTSDCGSGGGGGTPGGSDTQVQYNSGGTFAGISGATTDGTTLTLVAPVLGTPASVTLTNATGLPISTGVSGLGAGVSTFLGTPSSANLATAITGETGTGALVFANTPTLVTPILGAATATSVTTAQSGIIMQGGDANALTLKVNETLTAGRILNLKVNDAARTIDLSGNLILANNLTTSGNNALTFTTTGSTNVTLPTTGTLAILGANTFTATQTITPAANTNALAVTGYSLTGSNASSLADLAGTWNTSGAPTALKLNITDTASDDASLLEDLQVGGTSQFKVSKDGNVEITGHIGIGTTANLGYGIIVNGSGINVDNDGIYVGSVQALSTAGGDDLDIAAGSNWDTINLNIGGTPIAVLTATGLDLGAHDITMTGSLGATGARLTKGWFTDLQVTNAIAGSVTGNAGTVTVADAGGDTTTFPLLGTSATGSLAPATDSGLSYNSTTDILTATGFAGPLTGNVTGNVSGSSGSTTGNAATATALQNARTIGGVSFNGTANITVATATGGFTISGGDLALAANNITMTGSLGATGARLTKGWFDDLQVTNAIVGSVTGNAATATALQNARTINGTSFNGTADITITAAAGTLTGFTLASGVTASSLTSFGTSPTLVTPSIGTASATGLSITSSNTTQTTTSSALSLVGNSLTTGTGFYAASSSLTTGKLVDLQVSGTAADTAQTALNILTTGANAGSGKTTYGAQISNTHSTNTSTNVALYLNASGGATANYGLIVNAGSVGIGTTGPDRALDVLDASTAQLRLTQTDGTVYSEFQSDSAGDLRISSGALISDTSTIEHIRINNGNLWVCAAGSCGATTPITNGNIVVENALILDNNFQLKNASSTTVDMKDHSGNIIVEFDEGT